MVNCKLYRSVLAALLLMAGFGLLVLGCFGGGSSTATTGTVRTTQATFATTSTASTEGSASTQNDLLSTFRSKDPFTQQAQPTTTTVKTTTTLHTVSTVKPGTSSTVTYRPGSTTTTKPGGSTTTAPPASSTTTTLPHAHTLKVLAIGLSGGVAVVTLQVDGSVYSNKHVGDVMSTSWGQIKILDISVQSKVTTLLHGSETLVLTVGQLIYE